jgi:ABC-type iron transport system FetAB ATPase subunit
VDECKPLIAGFEPASKDRRPGTVTLAGRTPSEWGIPAWRARVSYVSQSRPTITGTPRELHTAAAGLAAQRARQGLTLVYFSAQLERFACDRGCA